MDAATAIKTGATVMKYGRKIFRYLKDDNEHSYALEETVTFEIEGNGVGVYPQYKAKDGSVEYVPVDERHCKIVCYPFPASAHLWNGPDVIKDDNFAPMASSLPHDLGWGHADEFAEAWGVTRGVVLRFWNEVLYCVWDFYAPRSLLARAAYAVCEIAAPWYHRVKDMIGFICLAASLALAGGCAALDAPENWTVVAASGTNAIWKAMGEASIIDGALSEDSGGGESKPAIESGRDKSVGGSPDAGTAPDYAALRWSYGGFSGASAVLVPGCTIADLRANSSGLSYRWEEGGCSALGASSATSADCLACLFVQSAAGEWRGGKFDWISTSRTTRGFENIREGYNGWPTDAIETARAYAFVIVSRDGRKRTNVIVQGK